MAAVFFLSYNLLVFFVLINVLLAIIVGALSWLTKQRYNMSDSYGAATEGSHDSVSIGEEAVFGTSRFLHRIVRGKKFVDLQQQVDYACEQVA